jgi:Fanconi anemia group J protein
MAQLGTEFRTRFEAPHVINARQQVWAGALASGPGGDRIVGTYEESQRPGYQDSVGAAIARIAATVPDGLLVFFPSYSLLDRLMQRWQVRCAAAFGKFVPVHGEGSTRTAPACAQATGLWARLGAAKELVCEPRGTGEAFDGVMAAFYAAVRSGRGAIFFAICRGKVLGPGGAYGGPHLPSGIAACVIQR